VVIAAAFARACPLPQDALPRPPRRPRPSPRAARLGRLAATWRRALAALAIASTTAAAAAGCSREPSSDVVVEPTPSVPTDVVFYTHVLYGGDDAYLVDGQWFRPAATGWVVFTKEPLELALIRESLEPPRSSRWFRMD
jgi:hypothetical protein